MKTGKRENEKVRRESEYPREQVCEEASPSYTYSSPGSTLLIHSYTRIFWLLLIPMLLSACASGGQDIYRDLLAQFQDAPTPEYYSTEVAKGVQKPEIAEQAEKDAFLNEVELEFSVCR